MSNESDLPVTQLDEMSSESASGLHFFAYNEIEIGVIRFAHKDQRKAFLLHGEKMFDILVQFMIVHWCDDQRLDHRRGQGTGLAAVIPHGERVARELA